MDINFSNSKLPIIRSFVNRISNRKKCRLVYSYYDAVLKKFNITHIYLPYLSSLTDERILALYSLKHRIILNKYDEGTAVEVKRTYGKKIRNLVYETRVILNKLLDDLFYFKIFDVKLPNEKSVVYKKYFTAFPEMYSFTNVNEKIKINFENYFNNENKSDNFKNYSLYLSDPHDEKGIDQSWESELNMLEKIFIKHGPNILIKFHPREHKVRVIKILNSIPFIQLSQELSVFSAEDLISKYRFKSIIGTVCTTMFFSSKFTEVDTFSYIEFFPQKGYTKNFKKFIIEEFKNIELVLK